MLLYQWLTETVERSENTKAVIYRDTYLSWRGLCERVDRRARELSTIGIHHGHWVGLMLGNVPEFIIFSLALSKLGATLVPIDPSMGVRELQHLLEVLPLRALITRPRGGTDPSTSLPPSGARNSSPSKPFSDSKPSSLIEPEVRKRLQGTLITCALYKREAPSIASIPVIFVSSDQWGRPKGVLRKEENLVAQCHFLGGALDLQSDDHILALVPLHTAYSFEGSFLLALRYGITLYIEEETAPARVLKLLREQEISIFPGVPRIYASLTKILMASPKLVVPRPRFLSSESYLDPTIADAFHDRFGPRICSLYRTTEAGVISIDREGKCPNTVGTPIEGVEVKLNYLPKENKDFPEAQIWVRSKGCSQIAVDASPDASLDFLRKQNLVGILDAEGWLHTGDIGYESATGQLILKGREDDMVKIGEKRVMLHEVAACLETHPKVRFADVKAKLEMDQTVLLVATTTCGGACQEEELLDHCARHLAPYKVPRRVEITIES